MNKLAITSVIASYMDRNSELSEVQVALNEVDRLFFSGFERWLRMIGHGPTYRGKANSTFEGGVWMF